jgi:hypothetical protein
MHETHNGHEAANVHARGCGIKPAVRGYATARERLTQAVGVLMK